MKKLLLVLLLAPLIGVAQQTNIATLPVWLGANDSAKIVGSVNGLTKNFWAVDLLKKVVKYTDTSSLLSGYTRIGISYTKSQADALLAGKINVSDSAAMLSAYTRTGIAYSKAQSDAKYQLAGSYLIASDLSPYLLSATAASTYATVAQNALKINITDSAAMLAAYTRTGVAFTKAQSDARYLQSFSELDPKRVTTAAFAGSTTKTLTLTLADASTVTASFNDNNTGGSNTVSLPITLTGADIGADTTTSTTGLATKGYALNLANGKASIAQLNTDTTAVGNRLTSVINATNATVATNTTALSGKQATLPTGTTSQYFRGDLSLATFPAIPAAVDTSGLGARVTANINTTNANLLTTGVKTKIPDYLIVKSGSTISAYDKNGATAFSGTDAYTVIQAAINALTPAGARGSGGGLIHISKAVYFLSNELTIVGWEGGTLNNSSQLILEGDGLATQLVQQTSLKNGIVVNNAASFVLRDLFIYTDTGAKSCLLADNTGTQSELSCVRSKIDNVLFQSASTAYPAVYLKNFFDLDAPKMTADNSAFDGMILETNSASTNYGGSSFGWLRCIGSTATGRAGLRIKNTGNTNYMNGLSFQYFMCISGYYGIYAEGLKFSTFHYVDIESQTYPVYFTGTSAAYNHETQNVNILGGYISPSGSGTAITNTIYSNANRFANIQIDGGTGVIPILDQQNFRYVNSYDIISTTTQAANISITNAATTPLIVRKNDGSVLNNTVSTSFIVGETPTGTINGTNTVFVLANTPVSGKEVIYVDGIRQKRGTDYTISGATYTMTIAPPTGSILIEDYLK